MSYAALVALPSLGAFAESQPRCRPISEPAPGAWDWAAFATVEIDPRVELLCVVHVLSGRGVGEAEQAPLVARRFAAWSRHPVVRRYRAEARHALPRWMELLLHASPPPGLSLEAAIPESVLGGVGGGPAARIIVAELEDFSLVSSFSEFHAAQRPSHERALALARRELASGLDPRALAVYLGVAPRKKYRFLVAGLCRKDGASMAMRQFPDLVVETRYRDEGSDAQYSLGGVGSSLAHELAHEVTRPWSERHAAQVSALAGRRPEGCNDDADTGWTSCLDEHVVRSVEHRLWRRAARAGRPTPEISFDFKEFPFYETLVAALDEYEARRTCFPTLGHFYPRLVEAMRVEMVSWRRSSERKP